MAHIISREEFDNACDALWTEIEYQNSLPRRTDDEANDVPGFATLGRVYLRKMEEDWAMNPGPDESAMHGMRKVTAIFLRGMMYVGVRYRD